MESALILLFFIAMYALINRGKLNLENDRRTRDEETRAEMKRLREEVDLLKEMVSGMMLRQEETRVMPAPAEDTAFKARTLDEV